jgi:hypothetical protein
MELSDLHKMVLVECALDDVQLCEIVYRANDLQHYRRDEALPARVRQKVIEIIQDLLQEKLIRAGFPPALEANEQVWTYLSLPPTETIEYIEREWDNLGHNPSLGDIVWFRATDAGEQLAQEILSSRNDKVSAS